MDGYADIIIGLFPTQTNNTLNMPRLTRFDVFLRNTVLSSSGGYVQCSYRYGEIWLKSAKVLHLYPQMLLEHCHDFLDALVADGLPVFGTCAGMILLAKEIEGEEPCFGTLDITVKRNAYGRQLGSFRCVDEFAGKEIEMPFIRAPYAERVGEGVNVLSRIKGKIVAVQQDNQLATAFHPELTNDTSVYEYFIKMVENRRQK